MSRVKRMAPIVSEMRRRHIFKGYFPKKFFYFFNFLGKFP